MEHRISATELVRTLGDVLGHIRYRGDCFVIERNGKPVARLVPLEESRTVTVGEALRAWIEAGPPDPEWADLLEEINEADEPPGDPWA